MKNILIATDGSANSAAAVREGVELAKETGAAVTFLTIVSVPTMYGEPFYQEVLSGELRTAREAVDAAMAEARRVGIDADSEIIEGDAAGKIVELAEARGVDLVVIGSRGLGAIKSFVLGSVSRWVVNHAHVPVLVIKEPVAAEHGEARHEREQVSA